MTTAIRKGLIRWGRKLGTWLIERLAAWVGSKLIQWLEMKAADWMMRRKRPRLRRLFLRAAKWLRAKLRQIGRCAAGEFRVLATELGAKGVPVAVECREAVAA